MIRIHSSFNLAAIHGLSAVLESHGIRSEIRGEYLASVAGEVPLVDAMVELWVAEEDEGRAREILARAPASSPEDWTCPKCGESVEGQFGQCWNCQADRVVVRSR